MRILVINYEYPPIGGGGGFVTRDILEDMAAKGHRITVVTSHYKGLEKTENTNGVDVIRVPVLFRTKLEVANIVSMLSYPPSSIIKAVSLCRRKPFDIINTHFAIPSGPAGYVLSKIVGIPNVLSIHGGDIFDPSKTLSPHHTPLLSHTVRAMLNTADRVVAQSNDTRNNAKLYYNIDRPIEMIPLGINKPVFVKKTRNQFNLESDEFVFCTIGRLVKRKNIDDILKVLSEIRNSYKFKFIIIGEGPERGYLESLVSQLNLKEKVIMAGFLTDDEKFQILDLSDCYLSSATHEGFGLVFLEAMETGNPIISYNRGGQNDFLVDNRTGFLVELGDRKKFKEKVVELINNSKLRSFMSNYNRDLVQKYYISECGDKYIALFEETLSDKLSHKRLMN